MGGRDREEEGMEGNHGGRFHGALQGAQDGRS